MLRSLKLLNFRGFKEHKLPFNHVTIVVGQNNAGKSTIVEALRLLALVAARYKNFSYHHPPKWLDLPQSQFGISTSLKNMEINFDSLFYRYSDPPSEITATFDNRSSISIYLGGEDKIHAVIKDTDGKVINSQTKARMLNIPPVSIMPQVGPVAPNETILSSDYVKSAMSSRLAPLHFRNQLNVLSDLIPEFQKVVEETWHGVKILELQGQGGLPRESLHLQVRNEDFVAEVAEMGHGLQMWLQTMWFLTRSREASTVILDEPDVYMHADLQRRLIRYLRDRYPQLIVATHSIEIMSEVEPDEILVVDRKRPKSSFAVSLPAVQRIVDTIGSVHNIHLARLWSAHCLILIEGDDLKILKQFQNILFPQSAQPFDAIPNMPIGGWGGWNYAVGSSMLLNNAIGESVMAYCILDSDYHTEIEIEKRKLEAKERNVNLHIWSKKEIENYLFVPTAIQRLIQSRIAKGTQPPTSKEISEQLGRIAMNMEDEVFDALSNELLSQKRSLGVGGANKEAREILKRKKEEPDGLLSIVSGKAVVSRLSEWSQTKFGVAFSPTAIVRSMRKSEVHPEMSSVIEAIESAKALR